MHTYIDTHTETEMISRVEEINQNILDFNDCHFRSEVSTQQSGCSSGLEKKIKLSVMPCMINSVTIQVQLGPFQNARNI